MLQKPAASHNVTSCAASGVCLCEVQSAKSLTWFFRSSLGHGRPPLNAFSRSHLDRIFSPPPQEALQGDQADQLLSLQSRGQGMWQISTT